MLRRALVHELIDVQVSDVLATSQQTLQQQAPRLGGRYPRGGRSLTSTQPGHGRPETGIGGDPVCTVYRHPSWWQTRREAQQQLRQMFQFYLPEPPSCCRRNSANDAIRSVYIVRSRITWPE